MTAIATEGGRGRDRSEIDKLLANPEIAQIMRIVHENAALALAMGEQHTTQGFSTAAELAAAFKGELQAASPEIVDKQVAQAMAEYGDFIAKHGITEDQLRQLFERVWIYSRLTNPKIELAEKTVAEIEGAEAAAAFGSGLAALSAAIIQFTSPAQSGEHGEYERGGIVHVIGSIYGGSTARIRRLEKLMGIKFSFQPISEFLRDGLPAGVKTIVVETVNNPTLRPVPLEEIVAAAKKVGAKVICDNTFGVLTVRPLELGADLVVHSGTKYLNGRSEDLEGFVCGKKEDIARFSDLHEGERMTGGGVMAPRVAQELLKNMCDLPERLFEATKNARAVRELADSRGVKARTAESYRRYTKIRRPQIPNSLMNGMVALYFDDLKTARRFCDEMVKEDAGLCAVSLGAQRTYFSIPSETTHSELPPDELQRMGVTPGLVRLSCGIEPDLVEKVGRVLDRILPKIDRAGEMVVPGFSHVVPTMNQ